MAKVMLESIGRPRREVVTDEVWSRQLAALESLNAGLDSRRAEVRDGWGEKYRERLRTKQQRDIALWQRHGAYLAEFAAEPDRESIVERLAIERRLRYVAAKLAEAESDEYLAALNGTLGADPMAL